MSDFKNPWGGNVWGAGNHAYDRWFDGSEAAVGRRASSSSKDEAPTDAMHQVLKQFDADLVVARNKTVENDKEFGYQFYKASDGKIYRSNIVEGESHTIGSAWATELDNPTAVLPEGVKIVSLAGGYHTHPETPLRDENPLSRGDVESLLFEYMRKGYYWYHPDNLWAIHTGSFMTVDDVKGGRYSWLIENFATAKQQLKAVASRFENIDKRERIMNDLPGSFGSRYRVFLKYVFPSGSGIGIYFSPLHQTSIKRI